MNGYATINDLGDVNAQLRAFKDSDERRDAFVQDLVKRYSDLQIAHRALVHDFENEKQSRRTWQERFEVVERTTNILQGNVNNNCFALALIDGDGAIFQDALLQSANEGGSDAAHKLHTEIKNHLQSIYAASSSWAVCVQIFINLEGLAKKLYSCGIVKSVTDMYAFARAFSLNQPLFNIVDVGSGKERADHKIKEMLRLFIANQQCKHVILGGISHDNGYLPGLDQWRYDQATYSRISLLETTPSEPGFLALNFRTMRCPSLFRSEHLPAKPMNIALPVQTSMQPPIQPPIQPPKSQTLATQSPLMSTPQRQMPPILPTPPVSSGVPLVPRTPDPAPTLHPLLNNGRSKSVSSTQSNGSITPAQSAATPSPSESTWATIGNKGKTTSSYSIAPTPRRDRPFILLNAFDQRLDVPISKARASFEGLDMRIKRSGKVCNNYHIIGKCNEYGCEYDHGVRLGEGERTALRIKARQKSCPDLLDCRDPHCIYGHQCVWGSSCAYGEDCFFHATHKMDRTPVMRLFENDEIQLIQA
ncbi:hypothetical protein NA57DRAFT_72843 [Rhizodiscina lignyota]|uniref:C3H1-type domain-containing protein n=1 Tax=Rhizodiscina lignyota TaxID=1504668 RepID=A0A9P4ILF4_9PEZI|nr:hypothetical protein NA57DRAFT_72843 [Rhizodiscina lignyota]